MRATVTTGFVGVLIALSTQAPPARAGICERLFGIVRRATHLVARRQSPVTPPESSRSPAPASASDLAEANLLAHLNLTVMTSGSTTASEAYAAATIANTDEAFDDPRRPIERRADRLISDLFNTWRATDVVSAIPFKTQRRPIAYDDEWRASLIEEAWEMYRRDAQARRARTEWDYKLLNSETAAVRLLALARLPLFDLTLDERLQVIECLRYAELPFASYQRLPGVEWRAQPRRARPVSADNPAVDPPSGWLD